MLRNLLRVRPLLLRETGDRDVTVLDMAVRHGYAELVEDVLNMFYVGGQCKQDAIKFTLEDLLRRRNAEGLTVIGMAVMSGSFKVVRLLKVAIESCDAEAIVDKHAHDVKICSSLNYLTWQSLGIIRSPNPMEDDGNGEMNDVALSPRSSFSTGDDTPPPTSPIDGRIFSPIPPLVRDDLPLERARVEVESDDMDVHEIIERVLAHPIRYMATLPEYQTYQKYGPLEVPSFADFRETNSRFTEEHVQKCIERWVSECEMHP